MCGTRLWYFSHLFGHLKNAVVWTPACVYNSAIVVSIGMAEQAYPLYHPGFRPGVLGPLIRPIFRPNISSAYSSAIFSLLTCLIARVSRPWTVFAEAQRALPSLVFGPVERPPCVLHTSFPFMAGALHCCLVRFDLALHCLQRIRPPIVRKVIIALFPMRGG